MINKIQLMLLTALTISTGQIFGAALKMFDEFGHYVGRMHNLSPKQLEIARWPRGAAAERLLERYSKSSDLASVLYADCFSEQQDHRFYTRQKIVEKGLARLWAKIDAIDAEDRQRQLAEASRNLLAYKDQSTAILTQLREMQAQQATQFAAISAKFETIDTRLAKLEGDVTATQAAVAALNLRTVAHAAPRPISAATVPDEI